MNQCNRRAFAGVLAAFAGALGQVAANAQTDYPNKPIDIIVAFAPGAMDAMLALALTLHIDPIFVGAHHLSRFVFVSIATPGIVHLFGRPQEDVDD